MLLSEAALRKYYEHHDAKSAKEGKDPEVKWSHTDVDLSQIPEGKWKAKFENLIEKYRGVFATDPEALPPPMAGGPVVVQLKEGYTPTTVKRRTRWGVNQNRAQTEWARKALKSGLVERAPRSEWSSRLLIVPKPAPGQRKITKGHSLRYVGDWVAVNTMIKPL